MAATPANLHEDTLEFTFNRKAQEVSHELFLCEDAHSVKTPDEQKHRRLALVVLLNSGCVLDYVL